MNNFHRFQNFRQFSNLFSQIRLKKRHTSLFSGICREIRAKFHKTLEEKCKFDAENEKNRKFIIHSRKNVDDFWLKFWDRRTVRRSALRRSRRELSNEYLLTKFGFDTAENEPPKVWGGEGSQRPSLSQWVFHSTKLCKSSGVIPHSFALFRRQALVGGAINFSVSAFLTEPSENP